MATIRVTAAQAVVRFLVAQRTLLDGQDAPLFAGCWAIFGHGNVAGMGEALFHAQDVLPTLRAHNEQAMALAADRRTPRRCNRRQHDGLHHALLVPGATNMITAAGRGARRIACRCCCCRATYSPRRRPDPVLQQVENFGGRHGISANDCFRPVSRYLGPHHATGAAAHRAATRNVGADRSGGMRTGQRSALCQDVQAEAFDYPEHVLFATRTLARAPARDRTPMNWRQAVNHALRQCRRRPLIIAGGGVHYSEATDALAAAIRHRGMASRSPRRRRARERYHAARSMHAISARSASPAASAANDPGGGSRRCYPGSGHKAAGFHHRIMRALFQNPNRRLIGLNVQVFDAAKHVTCSRWSPMRSDRARSELDTAALAGHASAPAMAWRATSGAEGGVHDVARARRPRSPHQPMRRTAVATHR